MPDQSQRPIQLNVLKEINDCSKFEFQIARHAGRKGTVNWQVWIPKKVDWVFVAHFRVWIWNLELRLNGLKLILVS